MLTAYLLVAHKPWKSLSERQLTALDTLPVDTQIHYYPFVVNVTGQIHTTLSDGDSRRSSQTRTTTKPHTLASNFFFFSLPLVHLVSTFLFTTVQLVVHLLIKYLEILHNSLSSTHRETASLLRVRPHHFP